MYPVHEHAALPALAARRWPRLSSAGPWANASCVALISVDTYVSYCLCLGCGCCTQGVGRAPAAGDPSIGVDARAGGHGHRRPLWRGHPFRDLAAPRGPQDGVLGDRAPRRDAPLVPRGSERDEEAAQVPRGVLDVRAGATP